RAHEVRHLEGDREGGHGARDAEVLRGHHLANEPEDARQTGREAEEGGVARQAARVSPPIGSVGCHRLAPATLASVLWPTSPHKKSGFIGRSASASRTGAALPR